MYIPNNATVVVWMAYMVGYLISDIWYYFLNDRLSFYIHVYGLAKENFIGHNFLVLVNYDIRSYGYNTLQKSD